MTDFNLQAKALLEATEELKNAKRNKKTGIINGHARNAIVDRLVTKLKESGESQQDAYKMAWELVKPYRIIK